MRKGAKILVYGLEFIGDALFTTPFLRLLREKNQDAIISVLTGKKGAYQALLNNPNIDSLVSLDNVSDVRIGYIKSGGFDIAYILNTSFKAAYEVMRAGVPVRIGHRKEMRSLFLTKSFAFNKNVHYADNHLNLLGGEDASKNFSLEIYPDDKDYKSALSILKSKGIKENEKYICLIPGTTNIKKAWSINRFVKLSNMLRKYGYKTLCLGGEGDKELCSNIDVAVNLCGQTSVKELYVILSNAFACVCADTGPMHIATCTPRERCPKIAAIFGSTSPVLYGPYNYSASKVFVKKSRLPDDVLEDEVYGYILSST